MIDAAVDVERCSSRWTMLWVKDIAVDEGAYQAG